MLNALEAIIEPGGRIGFTEPMQDVKVPTKVYVLFTQPLQGIPFDEANSGALLSQAALAKDWLSAQEDAAWSHLQ